MESEENKDKAASGTPSKDASAVEPPVTKNEVLSISNHFIEKCYIFERRNRKFEDGMPRWERI